MWGESLNRERGKGIIDDGNLSVHRYVLKIYNELKSLDRKNFKHENPSEDSDSPFPRLLAAISAFILNERVLVCLLTWGVLLLNKIYNFH